MNRFAAIAALLTPVVCAADLSGSEAYRLSAAVEAARGVISSWQLSADGIAKELQFFQSSLPQVSDSSDIPESPNGDAVIVCDRGLLFDAKNSRLVYVGNVRMRDTRLTLHARDNLFLRLEELNSNSNKKASGASTRPTAEPKTPTASATTSVRRQDPAPGITAAAAGGSKKQEKDALPLHIETGSAEANVVDNRIILFSPAGGDSIELHRGEDTLIATPSDSAPARILADSAGNILIDGEDIFISYNHPENGKSTICAKGGLAYYHSDNHTLHLTGTIQLTHPDGKLSCTESLCLVMERDGNAAPPKPGFMNQFTGMRLSGINAATARGNVYAETHGVRNSSPGTVKGDTLEYDGITGECNISGSDCKLTYGNNNTIYADAGIHLLPDGDIELRGSNIHGTYERPAQQHGAKPVCGTFQSGGDIIFHAASGHITTTNGFTANDAESSFSCTGALQLTLAQKKGESSVKRKKGMPNLAISEYGDIISAEATGNVRAKRLANGRTVSALEGEHAMINMEKGSAVLTGGADSPAVLIHESNRIVATPGDTPAVLDLKENGDIVLTGKEISATMQSNNGLTTARGKQKMTLFREDNRIVSESGVVINSPSAIITTNAPLSAILQPTEESENNSASSAHSFGKHTFNYTGIKSAETRKGGTVRTEKGSMQCDGPIHVTMDPNAGAEHEMAGITHAVANGKVMLLTKDSNNQMIRASGDRLTINGNTGMKSLTGREVVLENEHNRHIVSGKNATIQVDKKNRVRIFGEKHDTQVTRLNEQSDKQKQNNSKTKEK